MAQHSQSPNWQDLQICSSKLGDWYNSAVISNLKNRVSPSFALPSSCISNVLSRVSAIVALEKKHPKYFKKPFSIFLFFFWGGGGLFVFPYMPWFFLGCFSTQRRCFFSGKKSQASMDNSLVFPRSNSWKMLRSVSTCPHRWVAGSIQSKTTGVLGFGAPHKWMGPFFLGFPWGYNNPTYRSYNL